MKIYFRFLSKGKIISKYENLSGFWGDHLLGKLTYLPSWNSVLFSAGDMVLSLGDYLILYKFHFNCSMFLILKDFQGNLFHQRFLDLLCWFVLSAAVKNDVNISGVKLENWLWTKFCTKMPFWNFLFLKWTLECSY